jgi:glycosyltransferase involved in cell wall biosynthesis
MRFPKCKDFQAFEQDRPLRKAGRHLTLIHKLTIHPDLIAALPDLRDWGKFPAARRELRGDACSRPLYDAKKGAGMEASIRVAESRSATRNSQGAFEVPADLSSLRVALVHDWLTGMRGGEKCLEVLCRAFPNATLHTLIHREGSTSPAIESMAVRTSPLQKIPGIFRHYRHTLPIMPLAARAWNVGDVDLVISLSHCVAKAVRVPKGVPHLCYCFTPMRYAWDGRDAYLDNWSDRPIRRALARTLLDRLRSWDHATADRVTHFVSISETIRERINACYGRTSRVIPPPVDTDFYQPLSSDQPRDDYYLIVSALVPYKKNDQAIEACRRLGRRLVVIGTGPEQQRLRALAGPSVEFLGWQSNEAIRDHYQRCRALLFPGEEDFGIVPVEALACGSPVIALGRGGAAETVTNAVGRLYPDPTTDALTHAIESWESQGSPHDPALARAIAESYSLPVYRSRLLGYIREITLGDSTTSVPPRPHVDLTRIEKPASMP